MEEAIMQISLYSKEWTNFNLSDPGITILENLIKFQLLQYDSIENIPDKAKESLLRLAGFEALPGKSARVLLSAEHVKENIVIPVNQRFMVGDVGFETNQEVLLSNHKLIAVYARQKEGLILCPSLLEKEIFLEVPILGETPVIGNKVYLVFDGLPAGKNELICYMLVKEIKGRNPLGKEGQNQFAKITWQCYTENGFMDITCKDSTCCFIKSGELRFFLPKEIVVCTDFPEKGYVICGTLEQADYDVAPKVFSITGFLFEAWQKETQAICQAYSGKKNISVFCDLLEEGYFHIYCKEEGKEGYCRLEMEKEEFSQKRVGYGMYQFFISYPAEKEGLCIKLVVYTEKVMRQYYLGMVYGYDNQVIELPFQNILPESFSIIAERVNSQGEYQYYFIDPNQQGEGMLRYQLEEAEGRIRILEEGDFLEAKLYIASVAVIKGEEGNVSKGKQFIPVGYTSEIVFTNPGDGEGGRYKETLENVEKRFKKDISTPAVPVTAFDYEEIVKQIPGLIIQKVKATMDNKGKQVTVTVLPYAENKFPVLSKYYRNIIKEYLGERRLLSTQIRLMDPCYLPINVKGVIYIKKHYWNSKEKIEKVIKGYLDYYLAGYSFGERLYLNELYQRVERLSCVSYIYELSMFPQIPDMAVITENNIQLKESCLGYTDEIWLELR